jgi:muconolactone delta-isomerase
MKILTIAKPRESIFSLSAETSQQMLEASIEPTKKMKDKGRILAHYYSPTSGCVIAIVDYDDAEEWMKDLRSNPIMTYYDQEIYPIVDLEEALKVIR